MEISVEASPESICADHGQIPFIRQRCDSSLSFSSPSPRMSASFSWGMRDPKLSLFKAMFKARVNHGVNWMCGTCRVAGSQPQSNHTVSLHKWWRGSRTSAPARWWPSLRVSSGTNCTLLGKHKQLWENQIHTDLHLKTRSERDSAPPSNAVIYSS